MNEKNIEKSEYSDDLDFFKISFSTHVMTFSQKYLACQLIVVLFLLIGESSSKNIYKIQDDNDKNVLNIFMIGDWGGPHGSINKGPDQDEYGFSIGTGMNLMAENFYVLRSRQHLKILKTDKMAENGLFLRFTKPPTPENTENW